MTRRVLDVLKSRNAALCLLICFGATSDVEVYGQLRLDSRMSAIQTDQEQVKSSPTTEKTQFLRIVEDSAGQPQALQTAMTRYKSSDGKVLVDLIGAVHIGEREYYETLNRQFDLYDVVLYELVAPEGTRVPAGGGASTNPIALLQQSARQLLGLESQLALIDYQQQNLVHADMSPAQMRKKMQQRGQTSLTVAISAFAEIMKNQRKMAESMRDAERAGANLRPGSLFDLLGNPRELKMMMAQQFTETGVMDLGLGETLNRMLIDDRNAAAMQILKKELRRGRQNIAIFYGAAHMPDFEERLQAELELRPDKQVWIDAWDLTSGSNQLSSPSRILFDLLRQMDR